MGVALAHSGLLAWPQHPATGSFAAWHPGVLSAGADLLPYARIGFDIARFHPALFDEHAIAMPRAIAHAVPKRQAEFLAGRLCARAALGLYGVSACIASGAGREPLWPGGFIGSITHDARSAAAIVCPHERFTGIGIDIETIVGVEAGKALLTHVICAAELELVDAWRGELARETLLTIIFSAKESFFKAAYAQVRRFVDFDALRLTGMDGATKTLRFCLQCTLSPDLVKGQAIESSYAWLDANSIITAVALTPGRVGPM